MLNGKNFEIIDSKGIISDGFSSLEEALDHLENELDTSEDFEQIGTLKIIEVHYVR
jgi:hypothetical protein